MAKHAIKQVDRLLSNKKLILWDSFEQWIPFMIAERENIVERKKGVKSNII